MKFRVALLICLALIIVALSGYILMTRRERNTRLSNGILLKLIFQQKEIIVDPEDLYPELQEVVNDKPQLFKGMVISVNTEVPDTPLAYSLMIDSRGERTVSNTRSAYRYIETPGEPLKVQGYISPNESFEDYQLLLNSMLTSVILQYSNYSQNKSSLEALDEAAKVMDTHYSSEPMVRL